MRAALPPYSFRLALALAALSAWAPMPAQSGTDPTRPPAAWLAAQPSAPGAPAVIAEPVTPDVLIVVSGPTRKFAVVDGQAVRLGDTYNGLRLVAINADGGVVWQKAGKQERTSMSPSVEKTAPGKLTPVSASLNVQKKIVNGEGK